MRCRVTTNHVWRRRLLFSIGSFIAMSIVETNCATLKSQTPLTQNAGQSKKQKLAEEAVDRLQGRFYETLDFETIWKEGYVADAKLRSLEVEAIIFNFTREATEPISHAAKERAYIATGNFQHAFSAVLFTPNDQVEKLLAELKGPYEGFTQRRRPFANERELDQDLTGAMNRMSAILHKYTVQAGFGSPEYKARVARFEQTEPANPKRIKEVFIPAGLSKEAEIYVVDREMFHYYLIEEQGAFKVLTILNRREL